MDNMTSPMHRSNRPLKQSEIGQVMEQNTEWSPADKESLCSAARELLGVLRESRNNLNCSLDRLRNRGPCKGGGEPTKEREPDTLQTLLHLCRITAGQIHNISCALSAVVGE